jgi:hypothetical protein
MQGRLGFCRFPKKKRTTGAINPIETIVAALVYK